MDWSSLPSLSALRAFAAYAQTGSVTKAGAALNVSHAAISQQMRALERHMGVALLDRSGRKLSLTAEGQALAFSLGEGFGGIAETVAALSDTGAARPLQITCTPSFAATWLMPRLARFRERFGDIDLMIDPSPRLADPGPGGIDIALRYGRGPWPGLSQEPLLSAPLLVVGAPEIFARGLPESPADLVGYPWLQELGNNETSHWLHEQGVTETRFASMTHAPGNLVIDGVRKGQGIAVNTRLAVEEDLRTGRLIGLFQGKADVGYSIVTRPGFQRPPLRAFIRWLRQEARAHTGLS